MEEVNVEQIGNIVDDSNINFKNPQRGRVYSSEGISPALNCCQGGGLEPKIVEPIVLGWVRDKQGNVIKRPEVEVANCVTSGKRDNTQNYVVETQEVKYRIRKLTPRECFRLMDCDDEVIDKIQEAGISNSQQYKMAGNSIVVNELYHLFRKLFTETENEENQLTLF
jgi:DNA (cytosine-5)-methyltransferase 1